jgi:hypothetical protein
MTGRLCRLAVVLPLALAGCTAPYQTFSPGTAVPLAQQPNDVMVYDAKTTTPDNDMNAPDTPAFTVAPAGSAAAAQVGAGHQAIAICYNRLRNTAESVKAAASAACGGGTARLISQGVSLNACTLLSPTRAVYACGATP